MKKIQVNLNVKQNHIVTVTLYLVWQLAPVLPSVYQGVWVVFVQALPTTHALILQSASFRGHGNISG